MAISISDIRDYMYLTYQNLDEEKVETKIKEFSERAEKGLTNLENHFLIRDESDQAVICSAIFPIGEKEYAFLSPKMKHFNQNCLREFYSKLQERFNELGGNSLTGRITHCENYSLIEKEMKSLGFEVLGERTEYKTELKKLKFENEESPLVWSAPLQDGSWTLEKVSKFMEEVASGDPDYDLENDNAEECIKSYLSDEELYSEKDCLQIGYLKDSKQPSCFIVAQAEPQSGWGSITYMGVHPDFRGQRLGSWVQKHGIELLKKQGGLEYHGGTNSKNLGMKKTFEGNGCQHFQTMTEWKL